MALLKRKSKEESNQSGGAAASEPEHRPPEQVPPMSDAPVGQADLSPGLERRWEEAWRRARGR